MDLYPGHVLSRIFFADSWAVIFDPRVNQKQQSINGTGRYQRYVGFFNGLIRLSKVQEHNIQTINN